MSDSDTQTQAHQQLHWNRKPQNLDALVGEWDTVGKHPLMPSEARGHASFQWLEEAGLLVWRSHYEQPGPPDGIAVIGRDDSNDTYSMVYYDVRGVSRIYETSLEGRVWKFWRNAPGFWQRYTGTFSDDGNTIVSHGELSKDGQHWENDLDLIYTRVK